MLHTILHRTDLIVFPPYPPDNHHMSDDVYLREGGSVEQRAPPIFGRATITLGIGPHF